MKKLQHFSTGNTDLYLVSFHGETEHFIFNGGSDELGNLIQVHGAHGINFISRFEKSKSRFKKLPKKQIATLFNYCTHSTEQLKRVNYIK